MTRESYQQSLTELQRDVRSMGDLVVERLDSAVAFAVSDADANGMAREVIDGDAEINETYLELENRCVGLIALQQPVASDLRFVTASFKIITDLERVGDLAANLARYSHAERQSEMPDVGVRDIGRDASDLLRRSLDAYDSADVAEQSSASSRTTSDDSGTPLESRAAGGAGDVDACRSIHAADDNIDARCQRASEALTRDLIERGANDDPWAVERLLDDVSRVLLTIRDLERVADHAVNIAARTLYMVENDPELLY